MIKLWKKERWLLVPCPDYDVAAMEAWLEQQAQKGLFLSAENGFFLGFACFEVGNPKRVRYRLDAIPKEKVFADFPENKAAAIQLAQEMGWEFVTERREFLIYRCDDETLPELNTDPAVQALSLKRVQRNLSSRVWSTCYCFFVYPILLFALRMPAFLLSVLTLGTLRVLALFLITAVMAAGEICDWRRLRKLRNHLQAGGRIEHTQENPGWTKRSVAEKIANPILTAGWIVLLLSFVVKTGNPARSTQADLNASPLSAASSFLTLPQEDADERDELMLLARRDVLVQDTIYTLEERAGSFRYDAEYYDMRAPWLAKWLADDFARYDARGIFSSRTYRITSLDLPALDADTAYCYFLQDTRRGHYWGHRVIVQKGCKVISADIWWTYDSDFPAETFARALLTAISE